MNDRHSSGMSWSLETLNIWVVTNSLFVQQLIVPSDPQQEVEHPLERHRGKEGSLVIFTLRIWTQGMSRHGSCRKVSFSV